MEWRPSEVLMYRRPDHFPQWPLCYYSSPHPCHKLDTDFSQPYLCQMRRNKTVIFLIQLCREAWQVVWQVVVVLFLLFHHSTATNEQPHFYFFHFHLFISILSTLPFLAFISHCPPLRSLRRNILQL